MHKNNLTVVLLAAGKSSRLYPFNDVHKSMVKVMGKPLIEYTLLEIKKSGIEDVIVVIGKDNVIKNYLEKIDNLGLKIQYVVQDEATGAGDALLLVEKYIKDDFFLLNAYRVDFLRFKNLLKAEKTEKNEIILLAKKVQDKNILNKIHLSYNFNCAG